MTAFSRFVAKPISIWTWYYDPSAPIPVWVARCFHRTGSSFVLHSSSGKSLRTGQWIVWVRPGDATDVIAPEAREMEIMDEDVYRAFAHNLVPVPDEPPHGFEL